MTPFRFCLTLLIALFLSQPAFAKEAAPHQGHHRTVTKAAPKGLFWEVHGKKGTVYLVGSIHMLDRSMYPLREDMEKAFDASGALAVEANVAGSEASQQAQQQELMQAAMYPKGDGLKQHIAEKTYKAADAALRTNHVALAQLNQLKPWFVAMMIEILAAQKAGLDKNLGLDVHFLNEATQADKPVIELESVEFQIRLFDSLPLSQQEAMLYSAALDSGRFEDDIRDMMDAWRRGDAEKMTRIVHQDEEKDPSLKPVMDALLTKRNIGMADKIAGFLEQGKTVFVVVGAGHLVGPDGVAQLLRNKGYDVQQR